jgi:hypothetical protein
MSGCGRDISQAVSRLFPTAADLFKPRSGHVGFVVEKVALEQVFFQSTSASPANSYSTDCSIFIIIYYPGLVQ